MHGCCCYLPKGGGLSDDAKRGGEPALGGPGQAGCVERGGGGGTQAHQARNNSEGQGECFPGPIELGPVHYAFDPDSDPVKLLNYLLFVGFLPEKVRC